MIKNIIIAHEWGFDIASLDTLAKDLAGSQTIYAVNSGYYGNKAKELNLKESETAVIGFGLGFAKLLNGNKNYAKYVAISALAHFNCNEHNKRHLELLKDLINDNKTFEALNGFIGRSGVKKYQALASNINSKNLLEDLDFMLNYNLTEEVKKQSNILAICGEKDSIVNIEDFKKQFANNKQLLIKQGSHNIIAENSQEIATHIKKFLQS